MSPKGGRRRPWLYFIAAGVLLSLVTLASRLADFGIVPGEGFGAGDWKRGKVTLRFDVVPTGGGATRPLGRNPVLVPGDQLQFSYGKTRYLYLWVLKVLPSRRLVPLIPAVETSTNHYGRRVNPAGEVVDARYTLTDEDREIVVMGIFVGLPYRLPALQEAAEKVDSHDPETIARQMKISSSRFVHVIRVSIPDRQN